MPYKEAIYKISTNNKKVKQKEYVPDGKYPVIDQGQDFIGGFTNDESKLLNCALPALVFGDHTKIVKLINYNFVPGADGVKVVIPRLFFNAKLFEIFTKIIALKIPDKGYARHFQYIEKSEIPFPPLPEQQAIVSKIEQLFSDLDNGIENFKKAQEQLKIYRQAVLKNACEGKLVPTEAELARAEGRDYEPADVLLERILEERREKWNGKGKYKEPEAPETSGLAELPEGWRWIVLDQILNTILAGKSFRCDERIPNQNEIGVVKVSAVTWGEFNESESKTCTNSEMIKEDYFIGDGDFLFSRANTIELVGACVIVRKINKKLMLSDKILRFNLANIPQEWVLFNLRNKFGRSEIERLATGNQESMRNIGQVRIRQIRIPLPPLAEQHRIVTEVERRLSICDKMEENIAESLQKAESLRQSILKKAFEGKLLNEKELEEVRSAPDWEPAEKLLERIKAEKINIKSKNKDK